MTNTRKGGLTLRKFFRVINCLLTAAALLAIALCANVILTWKRFPAEEYEAQLEALSRQTEQKRAVTLAERAETEELLTYLGADLRHNGEEAVAVADEIDSLNASQGDKAQRLKELEEQIVLYSDLPGAVVEARKQYGLTIRELEDKILAGESTAKICYWTLDDGPTYITQNFLDALDEMDEHVHVTFFTANGANDSPNEEEMLRREMLSGHSVQNHTYSHDYWQGGKVYISLDSFREQIQQQDEWLYEVTGFHPGIFRFPGGAAWGSDLLPGAKDVVAELGYEWADWNCNLYDSGSDLPSSSVELYRALTQVRQESIAVVLGHDWNTQTLIAMKSAIPTLQEEGYLFLPLWPESVMMGQNAKR